MFERAANAQHTRFDVDGFIATLFRAVHDEDIRSYVRCTRLTRKIATMFANSAISAGVDDPELIKKYLCRLLLSNSDSDCIAANVLSERYRLLLHTLESCDIQHLVNNIVRQQDPSWANSIIDLIVSCSRENFAIDYLQDFIAVFNFLAHPENMSPYIDNLEA